MLFRATMVVSLLLVVSCDLFTTRTPELPEGTGNAGWQFPESPEIVLSNLRSAMARRSSADYTRLFVPANHALPAYDFQPDPGSAAANPGIFEEWNITREQKHSQSLFAPTNLPLDSLVLLELILDRRSLIGDTASLSCGYTLYIGHKIDGRPREFEGRAEFRLLRIDGGGWYIFIWSDTRASGEACWSDLKVLF